MQPDRAERTEYRVLLVDGGGAADISEGASNLPAAERLLLRVRECWSNPRIQKRTVTETQWEDVSDA
jgi:hypothetical protein